MNHYMICENNNGSCWFFVDIFLNIGSFLLKIKDFWFFQ